MLCGSDKRLSQGSGEFWDEQKLLSAEGKESHGELAVERSTLVVT